MPHWVYRPMWAREQDVNDPPVRPDGKIQSIEGGLNGNAGVGPVIRCDLQYLYCPWNGVVNVEGGAGTQITGAPTVIELAWAWDQTGRQRQSWWRAISAILNAIRGIQSAMIALKLPRVPIDGRISQEMTLTFQNAFTVDGNPLSILRPEMASTVWTPDQHTLILDNPAGGPTCTVRTNGRQNAAQLGPWSRVTAADKNVGQIIFGIEL